MQQELKPNSTNIKNLIEPDAKFIRGTPTNYIVSKILDKRRNGNSTEYLLKWKVYPIEEATWEPVSTLNRTKDLKDLKRLFEKDVQERLSIKIKIIRVIKYFIFFR